MTLPMCATVSHPQTNIVRVDGQRASLMTVLKNGNVSTLDVIARIRAMLPMIAQSLPPQLRITPLSDQSIFVRGAIDGVVREGIIAGCLTAVMILVFLGSWRSTLIIAVSIPLSILVSLIVLGALGETINIMTLGGLALAVGILVDDATVEIENINRNLEEGKEVEQAILDGAAQIAIPAFVSTLSICIVFVPMFFMGGVAKYLFVPLAEAVVFAMLASYFLSRTVVPTMAKYLLHEHDPASEKQKYQSRNPLVRAQLAFERRFEQLRIFYFRLLQLAIAHSTVFLILFFVFTIGSFALLYPWLGQDFFPSVDAGQFKLHVRAPSGTRIEDTARLCDEIDNAIRREIPKQEVVSIIDNIGIPYSGLNLSYSSTGVVGAWDADITVALTPKHHPTDRYVQDLRAKLDDEFPGVTFYTLPVDMVTQILNFGLAGADRYPGHWPRFGGQPRIYRPAAEGHKLRAGHGRSPHPAAFQQSAFSGRCEPLQSAGHRIDAARCSRQPAGLDQRQLSDQPYLLARSKKWCQLQYLGTDAAI